MRAATRWRSRPGWPGIVLVTAALTAGCGAEEPAERTTLAGDPGVELASELQDHLDAGNAAYRTGDYDGALTHYREVADLDPQLAAGWYGIAMAQAALGNSSSADSARAEVQRLAPDLPMDHPSAAPANPH